MECRQSKREAGRALNRYKRSHSGTDKEIYFQKRKQYQPKIKEKKKNYKKSIHEALEQNKKDSRKFWSIIRNSRSRRNNPVSIKLETWKDYFENILNQRGIAELEANGNEQDNVDHSVTELDEEISLLEVKQAIRKLKSGKASGIDNIPAEFLKSAEEAIAPFLVKLFNKIFDCGYFPLSWSKSIIIPLFKKGDEKNPENYRGISLLSLVSKVYTSILNKRLYVWAEKENKISNEQAGFRKNYSTIDHIFTLVNIIKKHLYGRKKGKLYVAFIDYQKAFDTVDRTKLWEVLHRLKTSSKMIKMLKGLYHSVLSCVRWDCNLSDFFECSFGVKQGCQLSPLIFSLLIGEVAETVKRNGKHGIQLLPGLREIFLLLFADDIVLVSSTPTGLQNQLNNLEFASDSLGLTVNEKKTKVMVFRNGGHLSKNEKWYFKDKELEIVNSYKYLGFTLTTRLSFDLSLDEFTARAKSKVIDIMKTMWALGNMDIYVFFRLFDAQIKPMLLYASEIWGLTRYKIIESVHLFACKRFLNVGIRTPNTMTYGELGRYPLYVDSVVNVIRYWLKLQNMSPDRLPKQTLEMLKNCCYECNDKACKNWLCNVKNCLDMYGFSFVWVNGGVGYSSIFLRELRQRIKDCYNQEWFCKLNSSERFSIYRSFKTTFCTEKYISNISVRKFRSALTHFRFGICDINANKRFNDETKLCPLCEKLEDECHFLFECPMYDDLREKYLQKHVRVLNRSKLVYFVQNEDADVNRSVAMFVFYSLKRREENLNN